jgi:nucleoside-diphosphate-sugar epimerase
MMHVLVTGASGNVGTAVVRALSADPHVERVVGVARRRPRPGRGLDGPGAPQWIEADVGEDDLRPHLAGIDTLVHLAWLFQPSHRPEVTWRANAVGSARVFDAAQDVGLAAVVYASSVGAYSPAPGEFVTESWPTHSLPHAAYGREKAYVERALDAFESRNPETQVVRLRPGFIFQRASATEQRRLFAGPFLPARLVERGRLPVLPLPPGLRFQAVHADDVAEAYHLAVVGDARGAFNIAAEPVIDGRVLAETLGTRAIEVPRPLVRTALAAAWRAHLSPTDPALLDLVLELPLLDTTRARAELGWVPRRSGVEALREVVAGMASGAGGDTPPLEADSLGGRLDEVAGGVGERP